MKTKRMKRSVSLLLLLTLLVGVVPMTGMASAVSAETAEPASTAEAVEQTPQETDEEPAPADSEEPAPSEEPETEKVSDPEAKDPAEPKEDTDPNWMDAGLLLLVNGVYVPYNPITGEAEVNAAPGSTRATPSGIYYSDVLGAHGSDLNGYNIKAGGIYDSWVYGTGAWYPYSTGVVATTGKRVITSKLYCNDGPSYYKTESDVLAIPIRPSQESGWSMDVNGYGSYTTRTSGVPSFKNESLYSKYVPNYSAATWSQINLIYGVARGMGGMTSSGNANITAAASTLICNTVWGYIGLGSDKAFHGKPIMTNSSAVNQQMAEILVRCEVYSKEKGLTSSATGDNTLSALRAKGFTPTNTTGWFVASGTASSSAMWYYQINKSQSNGNQIYLFATNEITFSSGYTVSLKKTTQGSADTLACIQNNPLYTLQGAVYEIHQGSATGTIVETLTTDANGEATGTKRYASGTKLYAVEKTAPSGYLLNTTLVELTISSGSNVFSVSDVPTFDPNRLVVKKTGTDSTRIQGAVFKAQFFASNWADSTKLLRTWYFASDANGFVYFREDHLASGYTSDAMFKQNGNVVIPLGCIQVTEVQAADGYILPQGSTGKVFMFIRQGGTKNAQMGKAAGAYWGDGAADPLSSTNPKDIYKVENDADKSIVTAVNPEAYGAPFSLQKYGPSNVPLEGAIFRVDYYAAGWFDSTKLERTWYFKTDSNGFFTLSSQYLASGYSSDALFPTGKIPVGIMKVTEEKAPAGFKKVDFVGVWRMKQTASGSATVDSYWAAGDGYTPTTSYGDVAYVLDADPAKLYVLNEPDVAPVEIIKTSTDGIVSSINFKVEQYEAGVGWWTKGTYPTDTSGKITLDPLTIGTRLRITEIVPENYVCTSTNPQTITVAAGTNQVSFTNKPIASLEIVKTSTDGAVSGISFKVEQYEASGGIGWWTKGTYVSGSDGKITIPNLDVGLRLRITEIVPEDYVCTSLNPKTITLVKGTNTVSFTNKPIASVEIIKTSTDGKIDGISFKVERRNNGRWTELGSYETDSQGKILIEGLDVGQQLRITETVPEYYACTTDNPQTITLVKGRNTVSFANKPIASLEIIKTSTDGVVAGITFRVEKKTSAKWTELGSYETDQDGRILLEGLDVGLQLRITELVPENYECLSANSQTITLVKGPNQVSFENRPFVQLVIIKTSDNGFVEGIRFRVEQFEPSGGIGWWEMGIYQTDSEGKILLDPMPVGTRLRITELVPDGYICESENPQTVTLAEADNRVAFDNRRIFGDLEIIKVDESYPDTRLTGAEFTVTVATPGKESVDMLMPEVLDDQGNGTGVYRLEHIEYGSVCTVRETRAPEGFLLSDKTFTVTIEEETTYNISDPGFDCLTNREKSGIIQVKKVDTQGRAMSGVSFLLEFSLDGRSWAPVSYRETDSAVTVGGCTNELLDNGILVTDQNGVAIYPGLALTLGDRVLHYRLTEISTQNGMHLLPDPAFVGTLPYNGAEEITVTAVNSDGFTIPETGSNGFTGMSLGFAIAGGAALLLLLMLRKRRGYCV